MMVTGDAGVGTVVGAIVRARRALPVAGAAAAKNGTVKARITRRRIQRVKREYMRDLLFLELYPVRIYRLRYAC